MLIAGLVMWASPLWAQSARSQQIAHGRYLVENVAMCGECHSPKVNHRLDHAHWLQGAKLDFHSGNVPGVAGYAPAIAGLPAGWNTEQTALFLETGKTPSGVPPRAPMPPYRMQPRDAQAVAAYLASLPH
ncbi:MAG TPA: c-type cytochrome [Candidatus Binataceae bacterium]|nr:c-type cytochrome [Candidatus Binataceae bacterium]